MRALLRLGLVAVLAAGCLGEEAPVPQGAAPVGRKTIVPDHTKNIGMAPYQNLPRKSVSEGVNILKKLTAGVKKREVDPVKTKASVVRAEKMVKKMHKVHTTGMRREENIKERLSVPPQKAPRGGEDFWHGETHEQPEHHLIVNAKKAFGDAWQD